MRAADSEEIGSADVLSSTRFGAATGVEKFDQVVSESSAAQKVIKSLARRGISVIDNPGGLEPSEAANLTRVNGRLVVTVDSKATTFIDLLHETRHVGQVLRYDASPFSATSPLLTAKTRGFYNNIAEVGAYKYEGRLLTTVDKEGQIIPKYPELNQDYVKETEEEKYKNYTSSLKAELRRSSTLVKQARTIDPRFF